jgi:hypothetical protein
MSTVMKSDKIETPRTDAHTVDGQYREWTGGVTILQSWDYFPDKNGNGEVVHVEFARELERELITVTAERDDLKQRESTCETMDKAEKLALIRALQEIRDAVGPLGDGVSPRQIVEAVSGMMKRYTAVTAERDELLKDKARLDWLDSNPLFPYLDFVYASGPMNGATPHGGWRTHIDAAMRGEGES